MSALQAKSMKRWREGGYLVAPVERRKTFPAKGKAPCPLCKRPQMVDIPVDLFNVFDVLAVDPTLQSRNVVFIQVTDSTHHATRRNKILASGEAKLLALAGCMIVVESWAKKGNRYQFTDEIIALEKFPKDLPNTAEAFYEQKRKEKLADFPEGTEMFAEAKF